MKKLVCDVVIVGSGPVGMSLALQLAADGVDTILLEKEKAILREPRAVGIDGESLRTWQSLGLIEALKPYIHFALGGRYLNAEGEELFWLNYDGQEPCGFPLKQSFEQGETDFVLAGALEAHQSARHLFSHEVIDYIQNKDRVTLSAMDDKNQQIAIETQILVGCDGSNSTVRKKMGVKMQGDSNENPWLVIDTLDPYLKSGPPAQFFCDPKRPGMTLRISEDLRRWEWMLLPGESPEEILDERKIHSLIAPFTDPAQVTIFRKRVYNFCAVIAERWQDERVLLAGDAAHLTPPFAGQGLNAGIRDTRNLYWKISLVVKGLASPALLQTYEVERRDHTRELLDFALKLGQQIQPLDPDLAKKRDKKFAELRKDPEALQRYIDDLTKPQGIRSLPLGGIAPPSQNPLNGQYVQQPVMCLPDNSECLLDDLLGPGFCILGFDCDPVEELPSDAMAVFNNLGARSVAICRAGSSLPWPQDPSGKMDALFELKSGTMALIRPDRFIVGAFTKEDCADGIAAIREGLSLY